MSPITKFKTSNKNSNRSRRVCSAASRKSQKPRSANTLRRHCRQGVVRLLALKDSNEPKLPQLMTPPEAANEDIFVTPSSSAICQWNTKRALLNRLTCAERRAIFDSRRTAWTLQYIERHANISRQQVQQQQQPQSAAYMPTSPHTAAAHVAATQPPVFDFYNYAAITSPKERQQYCTQYEKYYDEYSPLLQHVGTIQRDYQALADAMQHHPKDSVDYVSAKKRAAEYYSKNEEEMLQRQRRSYYLHNKMVHILKLIADYDDSLSSRSATARLAAAAADYLQRQQQKTMPTTVADSGATRPQTPPLGLSVTNLKQHDEQQEEAKRYLELYQQNLHRIAYVEWQRSGNNRDADHAESTVIDSDTETESDEYNSADYDDDEVRDANLNLRIDEK